MSLDATKPADTDLVSLFASYLREARAGVNTLEAAIVAGFPILATAANADTTPSVSGVFALKTNNAGATTITFLDGGFEGQLILLIAGDGNTTIQHDTGLIQLTTQANIKLIAGEGIALCLQGGVWREVGGYKRTTMKEVSDAAYSILISDVAVLGNAGSTAQTFTLPAANAVSHGHSVKVKKVDATANIITIQRAGVDNIDNGTVYQLTVEGESVTFVSNGNNKWYRFN